MVLRLSVTSVAAAGAMALWLITWAEGTSAVA